MDELGYGSLQEVATDLNINRGNLYRYFNLETKPSVAMMPPLCKVLQATPEELLKALEVIGPKAKL
jgi:transcriptional regulator with XRE-family HTH domain